jgi:hypothetical protein
MGNSKKRAFQGIMDKILSRIAGWRVKTLSQAGRLILIKFVATTLPSYAMSTFLLPKSLCSKLDKIFKNLWWRFPAGFLKIYGGGLIRQETFLSRLGTPSACLKIWEVLV